MKIGVFYASETGNTKNHAFDIVNCLTDCGLEVDDPKDIVDLDPEILLGYDFMIFGSPTWNIGELQADLDAMIKDFGRLDLSGKSIAIYGCGDQEGYPDTYQDAIGILAKILIEAGASLLGKTSPEGHRFQSSLALSEGKFLGLALDNHNQADLSEGRIRSWVEQLAQELQNLQNPMD